MSRKDCLEFCLWKEAISLKTNLKTVTCGQEKFWTQNKRKQFIKEMRNFKINECPFSIPLKFNWV